MDKNYLFSTLFSCLLCITYYLLLFTYYFYYADSIAIFITGAGEGNRTLVVSLEGFCSTIELHPLNTTYRVSFLVERVGFEPT
jgi:hypothetical protein